MVMSPAFNFMPTPHILDSDHSHIPFSWTSSSAKRHTATSTSATLRSVDSLTVCPPHHLTRSCHPESELFTSPCLLFIVFNDSAFTCSLSGVGFWVCCLSHLRNVKPCTQQCHCHKYITSSKNKGCSYSVNLTGQRKLFGGNRTELLSSEINMFRQGRRIQQEDGCELFNWMNLDCVCECLMC